MALMTSDTILLTTLAAIAYLPLDNNLLQVGAGTLPGTSSLTGNRNIGILNNVQTSANRGRFDGGKSMRLEGNPVHSFIFFMQCGDWGP